MLVVFAGLPGTGKTTIAHAVAALWPATYLRIDAIEQAIRSAGVLAGDIGPAGYLAAYALAEANLKLGQAVIADGVNPLAVTRDAWRSVAKAAASPIFEVEIICSDRDEHRRRAESRIVDLPGLIAPSWASIQAHDYEPWSEPRWVIDTALLGPDAAAAQLCLEIERRRQATS